MSPRFMVVRETLAEWANCCSRRSIRRPRFLRSPALRGVVHLRADGLCAGQFIHDLRVLRSSLDTGDGNPRRTAPQPLCEIDGAGRGALAFFAKPDWLGSAVQWNPDERFGDWVYSGQEGVVGAGF